MTAPSRKTAVPIHWPTDGRSFRKPMAKKATTTGVKLSNRLTEAAGKYIMTGGAGMDTVSYCLVVEELSRTGVLVRSRSMKGVAEEAPGAYKDVSAVVEAGRRTDALAGELFRRSHIE